MAVESKALVPFKQVREIVAEYPAERFHLLLPTTYVGSSALFIPTPTVVYINPEDARDVYRTPGGSAEDVSFHATALQRIANAGGLDFDPSITRHRHDRKTNPFVCEQIAAGWYIDSLGQRRLISSGWVTHDLTDGSGRANLLGRQSPKAVEVARQFICEQCGTRAVSRAIRKAMSLNGSYKKAELVYTDNGQRKLKGFVAIRFRLDESDEDVKRALIARSVGATSEVFGLPAGEQHADLEAPTARGTDALEDIEGEVVEQDEPEIPDEPHKVPDVGVVIEAFRAAAKAESADAPATDELLATLAYALRDVWHLPNKDAMSVARRSLARSVFSVTKVRELTVGQIRAILSAAKELDGQAQLHAVREFLVQADPEFAKAVATAEAAS